MAEPKPIGERVIKFADAQCLPLGLVGGVILGALIPSIGVALSTGNVAGVVCVLGIFFIAGLKLKTEEAKEALSAYKSVAFGVVSILCISCVIGAGLTKLIPLSIPDEFATGLIVFFCMPCTINSGAVLAKQAGGNFALALLLTVACNLLGVLSCPLFLYAFVDLENDVQLPVGSLVWKLCATVFLPLALGKALRETTFNEGQVKKWVAAHNKPLTQFSNGLLVMVPFMKVSKTVADGSFEGVDVWDILLVVIWSTFIHIIFLGINYGGTVALQMEEAIQKSVVMVASSKTLPMAITVLTFLPDASGDKGLIAIPCIISHLGQIILDGFVASWWAERSQGGGTEGQGSEFKNLEGGNAGPVTEGQRQEGGGADPEAEGGGLRLPAASPGQQRA